MFDKKLDPRLIHTPSERGLSLGFQATTVTHLCSPFNIVLLQQCPRYRQVCGASDQQYYYVPIPQARTDSPTIHIHIITISTMPPWLYQDEALGFSSSPWTTSLRAPEPKRANHFNLAILTPYQTHAAHVATLIVASFSILATIVASFWFFRMKRSFRHE